MMMFKYRTDAITYLLQRGANIDAINTKELQTPLHWACIGKSIHSLMLLIKEGADVAKSDKRGYNSLIHACQYGNVLMAHYLIVKQGAHKRLTYRRVSNDILAPSGLSVAHRDTEGHTPLHWAAYQNHEPVARLLLSLGADVKSVDDEGLTPLHWAALKVSYNIFFKVRGGSGLTIYI